MNKEELVIIASGDSFFQGAECVDDIFFPNEFPGYVHLDELRAGGYKKSLTDWWDIRQKLIHKLSPKFEYEKMISHEKMESIIGHLSKSLGNVEIVNVATGGASQAYIVREAIEKYIKLKNSNKINKKKVLFLIGYTYYTRYQVWLYNTKDNTEKWESDRVQDAFETWPDYPELKELRKFKQKHYPNHAFLNDWYMQLLTIKSFADSIGGDIIFIETSVAGEISKGDTLKEIYLKSTLSNMLELHRKEHLKSEILDLKTHIPKQDFYFCLGGHWNRKTNEIGGKILADILTKKYNLV
jgi:hypothetical protein